MSYSSSQMCSTPEKQIENLLSRRSVRNFAYRKLDLDQLEALVEAGRYAPSGMNRQNTAFVVIQDPVWKEKISRLNADVMRWKNPSYSGDPFYGADAYIAVFADSEDSNWIQNGSCALENILLASSQMGLGGVWVNRCREVFESREGRKLKEALNLPASYQGVGFAAVGYPAGPKPETEKRKSLVRMVL